VSNDISYNSIKCLIGFSFWQSRTFFTYKSATTNKLFIVFLRPQNRNKLRQSIVFLWKTFLLARISEGVRLGWLKSLS